MSGYKNNQTDIYLSNETPDDRNRYVFEKEFAKRTLANLRFIDKEVANRHNRGIDDKDIHDVFEVTQLVNSFVGMIILPKEKFYDNLRHNDRFLSIKAQELLNNLANDRRRYQNTYTYNSDGGRRRERLSPKNLSRHFRNAIAHNNLVILPQDYTDEGKVTGFIFKDKNDKNEEFYIELTIEEIRVLLEAVCNLILRYA